MEFTSFGKDQSNTASLERRNDFAKNRHSGDKEGRDRRREHARQRQSQHRSERVNEKRAHLSNDDTSSVELDVEYWLNLLTTMHQEKLSAEQLMTMGSFISRNPSSISWFLQQNSLPILQTAFLSFDTNLQFAAASCATNLTLCEHESLVLLYPILPLANQLLLASSVNVATKIQLSWMIGNIGTDCNDCRKVLIDTGCIHSMLLLIDHLQSFTNEQAKVLFWSLCNCTRSIPQDYRHLLDIGIERWMIIFKFLETCEVSDILVECLWFCTYCTANSPTLSSQLIVALYDMLRMLLGKINPRDDVTIPVIRVLGNISIESSDVTTAVFSDEQMIQFLFASISTDLSSTTITKETMRYFTVCCSNKKFLEIVKSQGRILSIDLTNAITGGTYDVQTISVEFIAAMMTYCSGPVEWLSSGSLVDSIIKNMYLYVKQDADPKFLLSFLEVIEFSSRNDRQSHRRILQDLVDVDLAETMDNLVTMCHIREISALAETILERVYSFMEEEEG